MSEDDDRGRYRINWVAERTGVREGTLRAWERRYHIPKPARTPSGYRVYSADDVRQVKLMRALCERGMAPSEAALEVARMLPDPPDGAAPRDEAPESVCVVELLGGTGALSLAGALGIMERAATLITARRLGGHPLAVQAGPTVLLGRAAPGDELSARATIVSVEAQTALVEVTLSTQASDGTLRELATTRVVVTSAEPPAQRP